jgi:hypothetical protein
VFTIIYERVLLLNGKRTKLGSTRDIVTEILGKETADELFTAER